MYYVQLEQPQNEQNKKAVDQLYENRKLLYHWNVNNLQTIFFGCLLNTILWEVKLLILPKNCKSISVKFICGPLCLEINDFELICGSILQTRWY